MDEQPHQPAEEAADADPLEADHRAEARDRSPCCRGRGSGTASRPRRRRRRLIVLAAWIPCCIATSATPGSSSSDIMSPIANTSGWPGSEQSGSDRDAAGPVAVGARGVGQHAAPAATPGRRPPRPWSGRRPAGPRRRDPSPRRPWRSTSVTMLPVCISTPWRSSSSAGLRREAVAEAGEDLLASVEQQHAHALGVDRAEVSRQDAPRELRDLTGDLHARSGRRRRRRSVSHARRLLGILLQLGHLERAEDPTAELERVVDRLHARAPSARTRRGRSRTGRRRRRRSGCRTGS